MSRRSALIPLLALLLACGPRSLSGDDEADTSTSASEGDSASDDGLESSDASSQTDDIDGGATDFIPKFDMPPISDCNELLQDCPEGEKCVPYSDSGNGFDAHKCVPVLGDQSTGEPCSYDGEAEATDDCDGDNHCWLVEEVEGELVGTCHPLCTGTYDDPMCPEGYYCPIGGGGALGVCEQLCDPLEPACPGDLACYWVGYEFACMATAGPGVELGQSCGYVNDCAPTLMCVGYEEVPGCLGDMGGCCTAYCDLNEAVDPCPELIAGTNCDPFFELGTAPAGLEDVGLCISPP